MASPTAMAVNDLVSEYSRCGRSAVKGAHHPSATTWPRRTTMSEWHSTESPASRSSRASTARDDTPTAAGADRGSVSGRSGTAGRGR